MELFEALASLLFELPGGSSRRRTPAETLTGILGMGVFPAATFGIVMLAELWEKPAVVALVVVPGLFALLAYVMSRALHTSLGWTIQVTLGAAFFCFLGSAFALLIGGLDSILLF